MLTKNQLISGLQNLGITHGDVVLIHSDLRGFGWPEGLKNRKEMLNFYLEALQEVVGANGTLAVPAYFYEYARFGESFDVDKSPVSTPLGTFSAWFCTLPNRVRSCNPLQSIAAIGPQAEALCGGTSLSGYGALSPWHHLRQMNGKILFLGAPLQSMTYVHYIEQQYGVPHLYFKTYHIPVIKGGHPLNKPVVSAVRYLDYKIEYDLSPYETHLEQEKLLHAVKINEVYLKLVTAEDAFQCGIVQLDKNPYFFLKHPPAFVPGKIPTDGVTGPL